MEHFLELISKIDDNVLIRSIESFVNSALPDGWAMDTYYESSGLDFTDEVETASQE